MHNEKGMVYSAEIEFGAEFTLSDNDPIVEDRKSQKEFMDAESIKCKTKQSRMEPYITAKQLGKFANPGACY